MKVYKDDRGEHDLERKIEQLQLKIRTYQDLMKGTKALKFKITTLESEIIKKDNLQKKYLNKYQLDQYEGLPIDEFSDFGSGYFGEPLMDKGLRIKNIRGTTSAMPGTKTLSELGMFDVPTTDKIKDQTKREKYDTLWETAENDNWMGYGSAEELIKNIRTYSETEVPKKGE